MGGHLNSFRIGGRPPVEVDVSGASHGQAEPGFVVLTLQRVVLPEMTLKQKQKVIKVKYALMTPKQKVIKVTYALMTLKQKHLMLKRLNTL